MVDFSERTCYHGETKECVDKPGQNKYNEWISTIKMLGGFIDGYFKEKGDHIACDEAGNEIGIWSAYNNKGFVFEMVE